MASFWKVDGEDVTTSEIKEQDNSFKPIDAGWYMGMVDKIEVKDGDYGKSIRATLDCKVGNDMRKTSVNLKCWDDDTKKRKRAMQMLVLMFRHAGRELPNDEPDDDNLAVLVGRKLGFHLDVYDMTTEDGKPITGNWLKFVDTAAVAKEKAASNKPVAAAQPKPAPAAALDDDDDIPF